MTGATGYLECTTVGVPTPNVTLTTDAVDSNVMVNGSRVVVTSAVAGNAGNYTCNASNFLGFDEQTFELLVGSKLYSYTHSLQPFRADSGFIRATNIVLFCGISLGGHVQQRTDIIAGNLLVLPLSETVVIRAG